MACAKYPAEVVASRCSEMSSDSSLSSPECSFSSPGLVRFLINTAQRFLTALSVRCPTIRAMRVHEWPNLLYPSMSFLSSSSVHPPVFVSTERWFCHLLLQQRKCPFFLEKPHKEEMPLREVPIPSRGHTPALLGLLCPQLSGDLSPPLCPMKLDELLKLLILLRCPPNLSQRFKVRPDAALEWVARRRTCFPWLGMEFLTAVSRSIPSADATSAVRTPL